MLGTLQANKLHIRTPVALRSRATYAWKPLTTTQCSRHRGRPVANRSERLVTTKSTTEDSAAAPSAPLSKEVADAAVKSATAEDSTPEEVFYEGPGSNAELILSLILLPTLIYAPLSMASIGRRLWIKFKFTNKRLVIINTSPLFKRTIEIAYKNIKEIRTGPRGFGMWGDMVVFLRDGSRIELTGLEKYKEIEDHINRIIYTL